MWAILCLADTKSMEVEVLAGYITIKVHHGDIYAEIDAGLHTADFNYISVINFRICNSDGSCTTIWLWWTYGYL
jgi:hypothetical protein